MTLRDDKYDQNDVRVYFVGFDVLTMVAVESSVFWVAMFSVSEEYIASIVRL
jgi:hypothetical protein